jgi:hypothetical protein
MFRVFDVVRMIIAELSELSLEIPMKARIATDSLCILIPQKTSIGLSSSDEMGSSCQESSATPQRHWIWFNSG